MVRPVALTHIAYPPKKCVLSAHAPVATLPQAIEVGSQATDAEWRVIPLGWTGGRNPSSAVVDGQLQVVTTNAGCETEEVAAVVQV